MEKNKLFTITSCGYLFNGISNCITIVIILS